jgi:hypothetical protein
MGTRSLTVFVDATPKGNREIVVMYRQMDGYPSGHGIELASFLSPFVIVNGFAYNDQRTIANGMGCLAAQTIAQFKLESGVGSIYLHPASTRDVGEEYIYYVIGNEDFLVIDVYETDWVADPYRVIQQDGPIFSGAPYELLEKIKKGELE